MASSSVTPQYHRRRRGSLPAIKLGVPLQNKTVSFLQPAQLTAIEENLRKHRSGSLHTTRNIDGKVIREHKEKKQMGTSSESEFPSSRKSMLPATMNYNSYRGRRHSVDVIVASPERPLFTNRESETHKVWAHFCKITDPKYFDPKAYDKEELPPGSSVHQAVLADLEENEEEDNLAPEV